MNTNPEPSQPSHADAQTQTRGARRQYMVQALETLPNLNEQQLRALAAELIAKISDQSKLHAATIAAKDSDLLYRQAKIDKLTHELATLKRWKFGRSSEHVDAD